MASSSSSSLKFFFASFFLLLFIQGGLAREGKKCGVKDIQINQSKTGKVVEGDAEWVAEIRNNCDCPVYDLIIRCLGFSTVELVDPAYLKQLDDGNCLVNNGDFILPSKPVGFKYAWKTPTDLVPKKFKVDTSKQMPLI